MRSEDAVEIVRAALAPALPTASAEGLTRAAETVIRWGSEEMAQELTEPLSTRMVLDLLSVARESPRGLRLAEPGSMSEDRLGAAAHYRTWSRSEGMDPLPYLSRPEEEPLGGDRRSGRHGEPSGYEPEE
ncbi:hypothetical protein ACIQBJ_04645 [Kitasatospora sp. NPDC088391]|uniref:hypothetical protein n=1 Tax=Kitasatospora sp. NPDC088391 TaxID=3364074 RepID=UPI0038121B59